MGNIRKKTAVRGGEGGVKFVCDVCSVDITSTVRVHTVPFNVRRYCAIRTVSSHRDICDSR